MWRMRIGGRSKATTAAALPRARFATAFLANRQCICMKVLIFAFQGKLRMRRDSDQRSARVLGRLTAGINQAGRDSHELGACPGSKDCRTKQSNDGILLERT